MLEGVTALCFDRFVLHSVFCLDLMVSWLFPATRQGRRDGNMFPAFGQECPRASQAWPRLCLFFFLYNWPRCCDLRLRPSWPLEHLPILVRHVMVLGIRLGTVPGTVFLFSSLFCPFAFQELKTREKNAGRAVPPSGDGGRGASSQGTLLRFCLATVRGKKNLSGKAVTQYTHTHTHTPEQNKR